MINFVWLVLLVSGIIVSFFTGRIDQVAETIFSAAGQSVELSFKLLGPMALWLGIMNIARRAGMTELLARLLRPILRLIFPDVPDGDPAAGAILLNLSANLLGMGNSSTPLGIKAMQELQRLNTRKDIASPAMCTLLAINTSSITIIPATIIGLRAAAGSVNPSIIIISTLFATLISTITALFFDKTFRLFYRK